MAEKGKKRKPGKFCVAGGPGQVSCTNTHGTEGVSMHLFPSNGAVRSQWIKFVHKHQPDFKPTKSAVLCSVHFTLDCFTRRLDLTTSNENLFSHRHLERGSIPTTHVDVVVEQANPASVTDRERRMVSET